MSDLLGRIATTLVIGLFFTFVAIGAVTVFTDISGGVVAAADPETSANCEVFATVEGEDRYACDDFARGYTCYDRVQGMTFCVLMTEEYK